VEHHGESELDARQDFRIKFHDCVLSGCGRRQKDQRSQENERPKRGDCGRPAKDSEKGIENDKAKQCCENHSYHVPYGE
jgi:hypothetical protein